MKVRVEGVQKLIKKKDTDSELYEDLSHIGIRFHDLKEELKEIFKAGSAYSHSLVGVDAMRSDMVCVHSVVTNGLKDIFEERCRECPYKKGKRKIIKRTIDDEVKFDDSIDGDWWISDCPDEIMDFKLCQRIEVRDKIGLVFYLARCPRYNFTLISDVTHTVKSFERFKSDFLGLVKELGISGSIEEWEYEDDVTTMIKKRRYTIKLGTDIEAVIRNKWGELVSAYDYGYTSTSSEIGRDGHSAILELRPRPGKSEAELLMNIHNLIKRLYDEIPVDNYKVFLVDDEKPLGAHIHVSAVLDDGRLLSFGDSRALVEILSTYIGTIFNEVNKKHYQIRHEWGYGNKKDWRRTNHNGIEYRCPPSAWVASPEVARITLKMARLCTDLYLQSLGKELELPDQINTEELMKLGLDRFEAEIMMRIYNSGDIPYMYRDVREQWVTYDDVSYGLRVQFRNKWNPEIEEHLMRELEDAKEFCKELETDITVVLFGLKKSRGWRFYTPSWLDEFDGKFIDELGMDYDGSEDLQKMDTKGDIVIGLPYDFRMNANLSEIDILASTIKEMVKYVARMH